MDLPITDMYKNPKEYSWDNLSRIPTPEISLRKNKSRRLIMKTITYTLFCYSKFIFLSTHRLPTSQQNPSFQPQSSREKKDIKMDKGMESNDTWLWYIQSSVKWHSQSLGKKQMRRTVRWLIVFSRVSEVKARGHLAVFMSKDAS